MSGKPGIRIGVDPSVGHGYPPQVAVRGSNDCMTNNIGQVRTTDAYTGHSLLFFHPAVAAQGSPTVMMNQLQMHRSMDPLSCGDMAGRGSPDVFGG